MRNRYYNKAVNGARVALRRRHAQVYKKLIYAEYLSAQDEQNRLEEAKDQPELRKLRSLHRTKATLQLAQMFADEFAELLHEYKHWFGVPHVHGAAEHSHSRSAIVLDEEAALASIDEDLRP